MAVPMVGMVCFYKINFIFISKQVEKPSPQVSSVFQNLRLNNPIRRQLFKPIDDQEMVESDVVAHIDNPSSQEADTGQSWVPGQPGQHHKTAMFRQHHNENLQTERIIIFPFKAQWLF